MKKRLMAVGIAIALAIAVVPISNIVKAAPSDFTITGDTTTPTNKDINLEIILSDTGGSGVKEATMPDNSKLTGTGGTYKITTNGTYNFSVEDNAGNKTTGELVVANIFKTAPTLTVTAPTTLTNKDVTVTVTTAAVGTGNSIQTITGPSGLVVGGKHVVTENGTYDFTATDVAGNVTTKSITVTCINKVAPVITLDPYEQGWTNKDITVKANTSKGTLNESTHTFTGNTSFTFTATDEYGNTTSDIVTITKIDKADPAIGIKIKP